MWSSQGLQMPFLLREIIIVLSLVYYRRTALVFWMIVQMQSNLNKKNLVVWSHNDQPEAYLPLIFFLQPSAKRPHFSDSKDGCCTQVWLYLYVSLMNGYVIFFIKIFFLAKKEIKIFFQVLFCFYLKHHVSRVHE